MEKAINDEMTEKERTYEPIRIMEMEVEKKKKAWLKKHGWLYTCDYVDGGWRWSKFIEGKIMICDEYDAIDIEYNFLD